MAFGWAGMALKNGRLGGAPGAAPQPLPKSRTSHLPPVLAALLRQLPTRPRRDVWPAPGHAFELDCLRGLLPPGLLAAAEARAAELGTGADQVLIGWNAIDESTYVARLSRHCGLAMEDFSRRRRQDCPLSDAQLWYGAQHLLLPLSSPRGTDYVQAPAGLAARRIAELCSRFPHTRQHMRLTTQTDLLRFLMRQPQFADNAADGLASHRADLSAAGQPRPSRLNWREILTCVCITAFLFLMPLLALQICGTLLSIWFLLFNGLRLAGALTPRLQPPRLVRLSDGELPLYSILIALYREGRSVAGLVRALAALDYPPERLDIKLIIEPDDSETRAALTRLRLPPHIQVIVAPAHGPRTKPKALNYGLPFARGQYLAVFDAEDHPDPGQLRQALAAFRDGPGELACVQASLCIDNTADSWLAGMFTAEYAGQFDAVLQGFSRFEIPLPLGGSSNHFKTDLLREVGGWDAYNVTEDADLGVRLARFGYRSAMFRSTTHEEAPARFGPWLRQRTRWTKGWMQTWIVHMRSPLRFWRESGTAGFTALNLLIGGNILTALAYPVLLGGALLELFNAAGISSTTSPFSGSLAVLHISTFAIGGISSIAVNAIGLVRRGLPHHAWVLVLTPLYWTYLSIAAWRALWQLLHDPYRWEKTEHGLALHSRLSRKQARATTRA